MDISESLLPDQIEAAMNVPASISTIFSPYSTEDFLKEIYGQKFVHLKGNRERFEFLLNWSDLNGLLKHHRLDAPRIRLSKAGSNLPPESFLRYLPARRGGTIPSLIVPALMKELRSGAMLIIDAIDEAHGPIGDLTESLEQTLSESVQVNCYIGAGEINGFDLHWDDHDVFVLQVAGRKRWQIYGEARKYPLYRDIDQNTQPPSAFIWEGVLDDGDVLYIPRGWWHMAFPLDEPSIHLTFGVNKRNGIDLANWLVDNLRSVESARRDVPRFGSIGEKAAYIQALRESLFQQFDDGLIDRYLSDLDQRANPRPTISLPWVIEPEVVPSTNDTVFKLTIPRNVLLEEVGGDAVKLIANGKTWIFSDQAKPLLEYLLQNRVCTFIEISHASNGALSSDTLRAFLGELLLEGVVAIVN